MTFPPTPPIVGNDWDRFGCHTWGRSWHLGCRGGGAGAYPQEGVDPRCHSAKVGKPSCNSLFRFCLPSLLPSLPLLSTHPSSLCPSVRLSLSLSPMFCLFCPSLCPLACYLLSVPHPSLPLAPVLANIYQHHRNSPNSPTNPSSPMRVHFLSFLVGMEGLFWGWTS